MNNYKSSAQLKAQAKEQLFGRYGASVSATIVLFFFLIAANLLPDFFIPSTTAAGAVIRYLVFVILVLFTGIFASGMAFMFLKITCGQPVFAGDIFYGFRANPDKALLITLVLELASFVVSILNQFLSGFTLRTNNDIWLLISSILLIIGTVILVIISLIYSQAYFLLHDFPEYSTKEILRMSRHMMKGHKGRLFYIRISFLPLFLLGFLSLGLAFLWLIPYVKATSANFYMDLVKNENKRRML